MRYVKRASARARKRKGFSFKKSGSAPLGSGERFKALSSAIAKRKGVKNPKAIAAAIGRKKYGRKRFSQLSAAGRRKKTTFGGWHRKTR